MQNEFNLIIPPEVTTADRLIKNMQRVNHSPSNSGIFLLIGDSLSAFKIRQYEDRIVHFYCHFIDGLAVIYGPGPETCVVPLIGRSTTSILHRNQFSLDTLRLCYNIPVSRDTVSMFLK